MLEVGQPGELPLMRELTALQKTRCLRDPSTVSSWKSPVLEATSSAPTDSKSPAEKLEDKEGAMRDDPRGNGLVVGGSGRRDDGGGTVKRGSSRSPQLSDVNSRLNWELGREDPVEMDAMDATATDLQPQENIKNHLEKLGVIGDTKRWGKQLGGRSILHNWRTANCIPDLEGGVASPAENIGRRELNAQEAMQHRHHARDGRTDGTWPDTRDRSGFESHTDPNRFVPFQEEAGKIKASYNTRRTTQRDIVPNQNAQTLSPLALNSHDDIRKFSQSQSLFTLEEPYDEGEQYLDEEFRSSGLATVQRKSSARNVGSRSQSPLVSSGPWRSNRQQTTYKNTRASHVFTPPADYHANQRPRSVRPVPWETELLDYKKMDALELPRKESGKSHHRSKSQKGKSQAAGVQERKLPPESIKALRRKGGTVAERQSVLQDGFTSTPTRSSAVVRTQEIEPLPLLTELEDYSASGDFLGSSIDGECGRLSASDLHGELELEAFNASNRKVADFANTESLQLAVPESKELALCEDRPRNLSQKYRPKVFEEVVGQNIVTQALSNAILKGKIAPVYLFQGSRGTGKTSAARIFAAALTCLSSELQRPCGSCRECTSVALGKSSEVKEVDAASNNGIERVKVLLEETISAPSLARYKVFIIDECHELTTETWNALLKILEEPPMNVVFILVTTDSDRLPRTAVSRCQKFPFPKIKESEILKRLQKLANLENLELETDILHLIASRSDGSLRDAETTLDQLSLLGQKISPLTVYELVGSASDERVVSLLDSALLADTVNTVQRARELVDSGVEPLSLMSRLATLITDILAGTYKFTDKQRKGFFRKQTLSEGKLERLRMGMKIFSEAEKQLRVSNDRATWLIAALLQLGPDRSFMFSASYAGTSATQSPIALNDVDFQHGRQTWDDDANRFQNLSSEFLPASKAEIACNGDDIHSKPLKPFNPCTDWILNKSNVMPSANLQAKINSDDRPLMYNQALQNPSQVEGQPQTLDVITRKQLLSPRKLDDIWSRVVEGCQPLPLQQLLYEHSRLLSISLSEVDAVVHLEFCQPEHKSRCERSLKSIANVFEAVLGFTVEVKLSLTSLATEEQPGTRTWILAGQSRSTQGSMKRCNGASSNNGRTHSEDVTLEGNSLNSWKNQEVVTKRSVTQQCNPSECLPAVLQASGSDSQKNQCSKTATSDWDNNMPHLDSGRRPGHQTDAKRAMEEQLENAWVHDDKRFSPISSSACGDVPDVIDLQNELVRRDAARSSHPTAPKVMPETVKRYMQNELVRRDAAMSSHPTAPKVMPATVNRYMRDLKYYQTNDLSCEDQKKCDELDILSSESHEVTDLCYELEEESQPRYSGTEGHMDSQSFSVDGPRSSDADSQRRKGGAMKMVRRLTMRSRIRSLPSSDQNSPDDKGSSLRVPRFAMKTQASSQKNMHTQFSVDGADDTSGELPYSMEAGSPSAAPQKNSKLKGAAGSFARFFQAKLTRQGSDATSQ